MKFRFVTVVLSLFFVSQIHAQEFSGAKAVPFGKISRQDLNQQFTVQFPSIMKKADALQVDCKPAIKGSSSWANNNMIWTYNIESEYPGLPGGAICTVTQTKDLTSADSSKVWKAGTISYNIEVAGPSVSTVYFLGGGSNSVRETQPVFLLKFDGDIIASSVFANQNSYLNYTSSNAPAEKMPLEPIPADKVAELTEYVESQGMIEKNNEDWVLATISQNLVPGASISLNVSNILSKYTSQPSEEKYARDMQVRDNFNAKVKCARPSESSPMCLPQGEIYISLSAKTKWADIKSAYIEYLPFNAPKNGKKVRTYAEMVENTEEGYFDSVINWVGRYIPAVAMFSDTLVTEVKFKVKIEPQTSATVVIPKNLTDFDGRPLTNTNEVTQLIIGSPTEVVRLPQRISFFERSVNNVALPVGVVNLHQDLVIRKTGSSNLTWAPIRDTNMIIKTIRAYAARGDYRETEVYTSPLDTLGLVNNSVTTKLTGLKNHSTYLQFPFGSDAIGKGGLYAIEVSSPTLEAEASSPKENYYYNPQYALAQLTNLAVHIKQGEAQSLIWVTQLDSAAPVANADIEIRNCMGDVVERLKSDSSGIATFNSRKEWATDCQGTNSNDFTYYDKAAFFVFAKTADDFTFTHSSWGARNSYAMGAPGIEWYYSEIQQGQPFFHSVIGVNLVKPGQEVPVQLIAKLPTLTGFTEVAAENLPTMARVSYAYDEEIYYDLPIKWNKGTAEFKWQVPNDSSIKLGQYNIELVNEFGNKTAVNGSGIEVAEFKVPLMSGVLAFPSQPLVRPANIPVNATVRYANGVGAKALPMSFSYFFESSPLTFEDFPDFRFGTGNIQKFDQVRESDTGLPSEDRPALLEGQATDANGSLTVDVATQSVPNGKTVAEILSTVKRSQKLIVRARYMDQMGEFQTLSRAKEIYTAQKFVGTHLVDGERAQAKLQATVVSADGKPALSSNQLNVSVSKIETKVIGEQLYGGVIRNTYEREIIPANWKANCAIVKEIMSCDIGSLKAGSYAFEASLKNQVGAAHFTFKVDEKGRVYGSGYYDFGDDEDSRQLPLALNKESYKIGEKAVVSFASPFKSCQALVTLERESVVRSFVSADACQKGYVEIPVEANMAPNMFVSVYAITGREEINSLKLGDLDLGRPTYRIGFANLKADVAAYNLLVAVNTDKQQYKPKEEVHVEVKVSPEMGSLQNAKVTFVAIEEKILELKENRTYDVLQAMMQLRNHGVQTQTLLDRIETVTAKNPDGELSDDNKRKGGDEGGDGGSKNEMKRKLFNALVAFKANIPVVNGVATASFTANDSLTKFKVFAIVTDEGQKFGTATATYLSMQDTQSFANIPSVAYTGDKYPVRVSVQNNSSKSQIYTVEVTAVSKDGSGRTVKTEKLTKKSKIDSSSSVGVDVGEYEVGEDVEEVEYVVRVYDENGNLVDVLQPEPQKIYPAVPLAVHDSFVLQVESGQLSQKFSKEPTAILKKGDIATAVTSSLVDGVRAQIIAKLKSVEVNSIFLESKMNVAFLRGSASQNQELKAILDLMVNYTDGLGYVKYFPQSVQGSVWLTGSILQTLATEAWAVQTIPPALKAKFATAVKKVMTKSLDSDYVHPSSWLMLQILYAQVAKSFGDSDDVALAEEVAEAIATLPATELKSWSNPALVQALAVLVEFKGGTALSSNVYKELTATNRVRWIGSSQASLLGAPGFSGYGYSDETLDSAILLKSLAKIKGPIDMARPLALGLINASRGKWYISRTMVWIMAATKEFAKAYETDPVVGTTRVQLLNSKVDQTVDWAAQPKGYSSTTPWSLAEETMQVTHKGAGKPWVSVNLRTAVPLVAPVSQGFSIEKSLKNLTRSGDFQPGDLVEVTLTVNSAGVVYHVNLRDPIPAGSNIVGEAFGDYSYGEKSYRGYQFYVEALPQGQSIVKYTYQINNVGMFNLPPTRIEGVYLPGIYGETPNSPVVIK